MEERKIYILLTEFPDKGTKFIKAITGLNYPHASIGLEEDMNTFYSFVTKGFIVESINRYVKTDKLPFPCQLYELNVSEETYHKIKKALDYFVEFKELLHYSKFSLALSILHLPYKRNHFGFFCSQFVAFLLEQSNAATLRKSADRYLSDDLKALKGIRLKYQGNLKNMIDCFNIKPCLA